MLSYRYLALVVLLSVARSGSSELLRGASLMQEDAVTSGKSGRMNTLGKLNSSFNSIKTFIDQADINDETDAIRLEEVASRIGDFEPAFKELESEMVDDGADNEEWAEFGTALSGYSELVSAIGVKFEARGVESVEEEALESDDTVVTKKNRLNVLSKINSSFDSVSTFLNNAGLDEADRVKDIVTTIESMTPVFDQLENEMMEEGADEESWKAFSSTKEKYLDLAGLLSIKIGEVNEFETVEDTAVMNDELVTALEFARDALETVEDKADLKDIEDVLLLVAQETQKMESGETKDKFVQALSIMTEQVEDKDSEFKSEDPVALEKTTENMNEEMLSALEFARDSLETVEDKSDLEEIKDVLLFVAEETNKMESSAVKDKFVQALSIMTEKVENMDSEFAKNTAVTKENRMNIISKINSSFDAVSAFLNDNGPNEGSRLEEISESMGKMETVFNQFQDELTEEKADEETWKAFSFTLEKYSVLRDVLANKIEEEEDVLASELEEEEEIANIMSQIHDIEEEIEKTESLLNEDHI